MLDNILGDMSTQVNNFTLDAGLYKTLIIIECINLQDIFSRLNENN